MLKDGYTPRQRQTIIDMTTDAVQKGIRDRRGSGGRTQLALQRELDPSNTESGLRRLGDRDTRRALNKLAGAVDTAKAQAVEGSLVSREDGRPYSRSEKIGLYDAQEKNLLDSRPRASEADPKLEVRAMGVTLPIERAAASAADSVFSGHGGSARKWARLATAPVHTGRAFVEAPGATTESTAKAAAATALGFIPGAIDAVTDPAGAWEDTKDSYSRLYSPLMRGDAGEFRRQVREEGAGLQVGLDAATLGAGVGRLLGAGVKAATPAGAGVMNAPRPVLRLGAGPTQVRDQRVSGNLLVAAGQRQVDARRERVARRRAGSDVGMSGLAPGDGEVVKASLRLQSRDQRKATADRTSRGLTRLRGLQDAEVRGRDGVRAERREMLRAAGGGNVLAIPATKKAARNRLATDLESLALQALTSRDVATTREVLQLRRDQVEVNRLPEGSDVQGSAKTVAQARRRHNAARRDLKQKRTAVDVAQGRAEVLSRNVGGVAAERDAQRAGNARARTEGAYAAGAKGASDAAEALASAQRRVKATAARLREAEATHETQKATARRDRGKGQTPGRDADELARLDRILAHDDDTLMQALGAVSDFADKQVARDARILDGDETGLGGHRAEMRRWMPVGRTLGEHRRFEQDIARIEARTADGDITEAEADRLATEAGEAFLQRTQDAAARLGLQTPVYVEHRPSGRERHSDHAPGGSRAIAGPKATRYRLFDEGRYDTTPGAYDGGLLRTIKRTVNWNTVTDILESSSPADARGLTLRQAHDYINREGLNPDDWHVVDLNIIRRAAPDRDAQSARAGEGGVDDPAIHEALQRATVTLDGTPSVFVQGGPTFVVVPRAVSDELRAATTPGSALRRGLQKAQGITSAAILNTSPVFVPIQVASNVVLSLPGSRGRVATAPYRRWRKKIEAEGADAETLAMVDEFLGSAPLSDLTRSPHFGAATDNKLAGFYQSFVDSDAVNGARESRLNPLTWNRKLDQRQNDYFRRNAFFGRLERDLHRPFNGAVAEAQELADALAMPAGDAKRARLRELEPQIARYAEHVDDMLGNWTRYTVTERRLGRSFLLFYGFMRFATKLALYTLPVKHPVAANIVRQVAQMQNDEVVDLLSSRFLKENRSGYTRDEVERAIRRELLSQFGGRVYFERDGQLGYFDVGRASPLTSPIFDLFSDPRSGSLGLLSPILGSLLTTLLGETERGAKLNTNGVFTAFGADPQIGLDEGARIVTRDTLRLSPALRAADDALSGPEMQGSDSLPLLGDRPLRPISRAERARVDRFQDGRPDGSAGRFAHALTTPLRLTDSQSMARVQQVTDYPELDAAKVALRALQSRGEGGTAEGDRLRAQIARIETRAGLRRGRRRRPRSASARGGVFGGGGGDGIFGTTSAQSGSSTTGGGVFD